MKLTSVFLAGALALGAASSADATIVLTPGSGWQNFSFSGVGKTFSDNFEFNIASTSVFKITDTFFDGDQFAISGDGGLFYINASVPVSDGDFIGDYDAAFASPKFSSLSLLLSPGSYVLTGKVLASPYSRGSGGVELISAPEPAAWTLMIVGFGVIGAAFRRRVKAPTVTYAAA